jgi:hypothetical protein
MCVGAERPLLDIIAQARGRQTAVELARRRVRAATRYRRWS